MENDWREGASCFRKLHYSYKYYSYGSTPQLIKKNVLSLLSLLFYPSNNNNNSSWPSSQNGRKGENALTRASLPTTCQGARPALLRKWLCLFTPRTNLLTCNYLTSFVHPAILSSSYKIPPCGTEM